MWAIGKPEAVTLELIPARGDEPAVKVTFNAQPSPLSLRAARRAVSEVLQAGEDAAAMERAGDAFTAALIRHNIIGWAGIGDAEGAPVQPTHDVEHRDGDTVTIVAGTISGFLAEPRLVEAADAKYVAPWCMADAEKNGWRPLPNGTGEAAAPAADIASSSARPAPKAGAATKKRARKPVPTTSTRH